MLERGEFTTLLLTGKVAVISLLGEMVVRLWQGH